MTQIYKNIIPNLNGFRKISILVFFLVASISVYSQNKTVQITDGDITIKQAFRKIEQQTGYTFAYSSDEFTAARNLELPKIRTNLAEMMDLILKNTGFKYRIIGRTIAIHKSSLTDELKEALFPVETHDISGIILDHVTGNPLTGAKVFISGLENLVVEADFAGRFTINNVPVGFQQIVTVFEGYYLSERGIEVSKKNTAEILITLKSNIVNKGSIRSEADKGDIISGIYGPEEEPVEVEVPQIIQKDSTISQMPIRETYQSHITSSYPFEIQRNNIKWGLKTNLLYLATGSPNLGIEWAMGKKFTGEITAGINMLEYGNDMSLGHWLVKPELRYWLCRQFDGHFFGVHGIVGQFDVSNLPIDRISNFSKDKAYQGWAYGGGVTYGYQWAIGKRLNLEAAIGVGYLRLEHTVYDMYGDCVNCRGREGQNYIGPTKAGLSLIYTFK